MLRDINDPVEDRIGEPVYDAGPRSEHVKEPHERRRVIEARDRIGERAANVAPLGVGCAELRRSGECERCAKEYDADDCAAGFARYACAVFMPRLGKRILI
jgi:hypothetical protein